MMNTTFRVAVLALFLSLSYGWGPEGHQIVAQIAANRLPPSAKKVIQQFLGSNTLPDIASIPDSYDHTPQGEWSAPCHFCNLPINATDFTMKDCPGFCVVKSIQNYTSILSSEVSHPFECPMGIGVEPCALIFLVHYVGDVHQPLHVSYAYDEGGNKVKVSFFGKKTNLHAVWDTQIIEKWNSDLSSAASELEEVIQQNPSLAQKYLSQMNPILWANESFTEVLDTVYKFSPSMPRTSLSEVELGEWYYNQNLPVIKNRLIAGGLRLAKLLEGILS